MKTKMNLNGTTRKALVAAIGEITSEKPIYRNMPTSNYDIGEITVTKDGSIETALDNLHKLVDAKASLITKALCATGTGTVADGKTCFSASGDAP